MALTAADLTLVDLLERTFEPRALDQLLGGLGGAVPAEVWERALLGPARDFLARPGKAFRARLVHAGYQLGGGRDHLPAILPLLVELLHAGSLIVDDIEDGSTHRRGVPALHLRHGLPLALNTGNWMYFLPAALLERAGFPADLELALHRALDRTLVRCHHGQALDIAVRVWEIPRADLPALADSIALLKSGSLVELAIALGAIAAGASPGRCEDLGAFGRALGIGLQRLDDLGGLAGDPHKRYEDLRLGRVTFVWAALAAGDTDEADYDMLISRAREGADVAALAADLRARSFGSARSVLRRDLRRAVAAIGDAGSLTAEIERLERAYGA